MTTFRDLDYLNQCTFSDTLSTGMSDVDGEIMLLLLTIATVVLQVFSDRPDSFNSQGFQEINNTSMIKQTEHEQQIQDFHKNYRNSAMSITPDFLRSMDRLSKALDNMERNQIPNHHKMRKERNLNLRASHSYPVVKKTVEQQRKKRHKHNRIHLTKRFQAKPTTEKNIHAEPKCEANSTAMNTTKPASKNKTNGRADKELEEYERLNSEMDDQDEEEEEYDDDDDDDYECEEDTDDEGAWGDHERSSLIKNPEQTDQKLNSTMSKFNEFEKITNETAKSTIESDVDSHLGIIVPTSSSSNVTGNPTELKLSLSKKSEIGGTKTEEKGGKINEAMNRKVAKSRNKVKEMSPQDRFGGIKSGKKSKTAIGSVTIKFNESPNETDISVTTNRVDRVSYSTASIKNTEERVLEDSQGQLTCDKKFETETVPTERNLKAEKNDPKIGSGDSKADSCDEEGEKSSKLEAMENNLPGDGTEKNVSAVCVPEKSLEPLKKIKKGDSKDRSYLKRVDQLFRFREKIGSIDASNETKRLLSNIFEKSSQQDKGTPDHIIHDELISNGSETTNTKHTEASTVKDSDLRGDTKQLNESGMKTELQTSLELGSETNKNFEKLGDNFHDCKKQSTVNEERSVSVTETAICIFKNARVSPVAVLQHDNICDKRNDWKSTGDSQQTRRGEITSRSKQELKKHFRINSLIRSSPCQSTTPIAATKETDLRSETSVTAIQLEGTSSKTPREREVLIITKINDTCNPEDKLELLREKILKPLMEENSERKHTRLCTTTWTEMAKIDTPIKKTCATSTETAKECTTCSSTTKMTSSCMTNTTPTFKNKTDCAVLNFLSKQKTSVSGVDTTKFEKNIFRSVDNQTSKYNKATTVQNDGGKSNFVSSSKQILRSYRTEVPPNDASESSFTQKLDQRQNLSSLQKFKSSQECRLLSSKEANNSMEQNINALNATELSLLQKPQELTQHEATDDPAEEMNIKEKGEIKKPLQLYLNMLNSFARKSVKAENRRRKTIDAQEKPVDSTMVSEEESHDNVALSLPLRYENSLEDSAKKLIKVYISQVNQPTMAPIQTEIPGTESENEVNLRNHEGHDDIDDLKDTDEKGEELLSTSQETNLLDLMFDSTSVRPKKPFPLNIFRKKFFKKGSKKKMRMLNNETTELTRNEELLGTDGPSQENDKENTSSILDHPAEITKTTVASSKSEIKALLGALNNAREVETENMHRASESQKLLQNRNMSIPQGFARDSQWLNPLMENRNDKILEQKEEKQFVEEELSQAGTVRLSGRQGINTGKNKKDEIENAESMVMPKPKSKKFSDRIRNLYRSRINLESGSEKTEEYKTAKGNSDHHCHKSHSVSSMRNFPQLAMRNLNNYKSILQKDMHKLYSRKKKSNTTIDQNLQFANEDLNHSKDRKKSKKERGTRNKKKKTSRLKSDENERNTFSNVDLNIQNERRSLHFKSKFKKRNKDHDAEQGKRFRRDFPTLLRNSNSRIESFENSSNCKNDEKDDNFFGIKDTENYHFDNGEILEHNKQEQSLVKKNDLVSTNNSKFFTSTYCSSSNREWSEQKDLYSSNKPGFLQTIGTILTPAPLIFMTEQNNKNLKNNSSKVIGENTKTLGQPINDKERDFTENYALTGSYGQRAIHKYDGLSLIPLSKARTVTSYQNTVGSTRLMPRNFESKLNTNLNSSFNVNKNNLHFFFEPTALVDGTRAPTEELLKTDAKSGEIPCPLTPINASRENLSSSLNHRQSDQQYNNITLIAIKQKNQYSINMPAVETKENFGADKAFVEGDRKIILDLKNIRRAPGNNEPIKIVIELTTLKDQSKGKMDLQGNLSIDSYVKSGSPSEIRSGTKNLNSETSCGIVDGTETSFQTTIGQSINSSKKLELSMKDDLKKSYANCFLQPIRIKSNAEKENSHALNEGEKNDFQFSINKAEFGCWKPSMTDENPENLTHSSNAFQSLQRMENFNDPHISALQNSFGNHRDELKENSQGDSKGHRKQIYNSEESKGYYRGIYHPGDPSSFMNPTTMKFEVEKIPFEMSEEYSKNTKQNIESKTTILYQQNNRSVVTRFNFEQSTTKFGNLPPSRQNSVELQQPYRPATISPLFTRSMYDALDRRINNNSKLPAGQYPTKITFLVTPTPLQQADSPMMLTTRIDSFENYTIKPRPSYKSPRYFYAPSHEDETFWHDTETQGLTKAWKPNRRIEQIMKAEKQQPSNHRLTEGSIKDVGELREKIRQRTYASEQNQKAAIERQFGFEDTLKREFITDSGEYNAASIYVTPSEQEVGENTSRSLEPTISAAEYTATLKMEESNQAPEKHSGDEKKIQTATQKSETSAMNSLMKFYGKILKGITERNLMTGKLPEYNHRKIYVFEITTRVTPETKGKLYRDKGEPIVATVTQSGVESKIGQLTEQKDLVDNRGHDAGKKETKLRTTAISTKALSPVLTATITPQREAAMKTGLANNNSLQSTKTESTTLPHKIESVGKTPPADSPVEDASDETGKKNCLLDFIADRDTTRTDSSSHGANLMESVSSTLQGKLDESFVSSPSSSGRVVKNGEKSLRSHDPSRRTTKKKTETAQAAVENQSTVYARTGKWRVDSDGGLGRRGFESKLTRWNDKNNRGELNYNLGMEDGLLNRESNRYFTTELSSAIENQPDKCGTMLLARKATNPIEGVGGKHNQIDKNWIWSTTEPNVSSLKIGGPLELQHTTIRDTKEETFAARSKSKSDFSQYDGGLLETSRYIKGSIVAKNETIKIKGDSRITDSEPNESSKNESILSQFHNFSKGSATSFQKGASSSSSIFPTQITNAPLKNQNGSKRNHVIPRPVQFLCDNPKNYFPVLPIIQDEMHGSKANYSTTDPSRFSEMNSDPSIATHRKSSKYNLKESTFPPALQNQSSRSLLLSQPVACPNHRTVGSIKSQSDGFKVEQRRKINPKILENTAIGLDTCAGESQTNTIPSNITLNVKESKMANDPDIEVLGQIDQIERRKLKMGFLNPTGSIEYSTDDPQTRKNFIIKENLPVSLTSQMDNSKQIKPKLKNKKIPVLENFHDSSKTFATPRAKSNTAPKIESGLEETIRFKKIRGEKNRQSEVSHFPETPSAALDIPKIQTSQKFFQPSSKPRLNFEAPKEPSLPSLDNDILNGQLAMRIVDDVFSKVQKSKQLSSEFGCCRNNLTKVKEEVLPLLAPAEAKIQADVIRDMVSMINLYLIKQPKAACMVLPPELKIFLTGLIADDQPLRGREHGEKAKPINVDLNDPFLKKQEETRVEEQGVSKDQKQKSRPKAFGNTYSKLLTQKKIRCHDFNFDEKRANSLGTTGEKKCMVVKNNRTEIQKCRVFGETFLSAGSRECGKKKLAEKDRVQAEVKRKSHGWRLRTRQPEKQEISLHEGPKQSEDGERLCGEIGKAENSAFHRKNQRDDLRLENKDNLDFHYGNFGDRKDGTRLVTGKRLNSDWMKTNRGANNRRFESGAFASYDLQTNKEKGKKVAKQLSEELSPNARLLTSLKSDLHSNLGHSSDHEDEREAQRMLVYTPPDHLHALDLQRENFDIMRPIHQRSATNFGLNFEEGDFLTPRAKVAEISKFEDATKD